MSAARLPAWQAGEGHLTVWLRLTPKGGRDAIEGVGLLSDGREVVLVRVRAAPDKGAANDALVRLIAGFCGRPASAVRLVAGATARLKQLRVEGDPVALSACFAALAEKRAD